MFVRNVVDSVALTCKDGYNDDLASYSFQFLIDLHHTNVNGRAITIRGLLGGG